MTILAEHVAWWEIRKDGDPTGLALYNQHYSARRYADGRTRRLFVGPGQKMVLVGRDHRSLFVWRKFRADNDQLGVNCAVFRNDGSVLSSQLIEQADAIADERWPGERHYTYVSPSKVVSSNPGYCFLMAGWQRCGRTKGGHGRERLLILERRPAAP